MKRNSKTRSILLTVVLTVGVIAGCGAKDIGKPNNTPPQASPYPSFSFDFKDGKDGWTGGFADLPFNYDDEIFELKFEHKDIPIEGKGLKGLYLQGHNRSDDLFMFITRELDGLKANMRYTIEYEFDLATNVAGGMVGIGGAPGESVYVKAGFISTEPKSVKGILDSNEAYIMNIDKGNQSQSGTDMDVIGHIAKDESEDESYQLKTFKATFEAVSNADGSIYMMIGTDSGFEGLTQLYYTNIKVTMTEIK